MYPMIIDNAYKIVMGDGPDMITPFAVHYLVNGLYVFVSWITVVIFGVW
jgi:hypothetical protein